jgi:A/G-specific adenine glycosylase
MSRSFANRLLRWYDLAGRKNLPWQNPRNAYRVWVSEIMLQQTQVSTVIPYFERFIDELPNLQSLAQAKDDEVFALWSGLGYYRRAKNLHLAAQQCMLLHEGQLPEIWDDLIQLPGIGRSTAGAILALAYGKRFPILDGNVKRVLSRHHAIEDKSNQSSFHNQLWSLSTSLLPQTRLDDYTQALMDLGATVCTRRTPSCSDCPVSDDCAGRLAGIAEQLPRTNPKKVNPERKTTLLIVKNQHGKILLEKRTQKGVWHNLWCVPEQLDTHAKRARIAKQLSVPSKSISCLPIFLHRFTHYTLHALPLLIEHPNADTLNTDKLCHQNSTTQWIYPNTKELNNIGIPTPIRQLLEKL